MKGIAHIVIEMHDLTGILVGITKTPYSEAFPPDIEIIDVVREGTCLKFTVTSIEFNTDENAIYNIMGDFPYSGPIAEA